MFQSFSSREQEIIRTAKGFEACVAAGDSSADSLFRQLLGIRHSEVPLITDTILSMCQASQGRREVERVTRLHDLGAMATRFFGLGFDREVVNDRFVPALVEMSQRLSWRAPRSMGERISRFEKVSALAQLVPLLEDEAIDEVLEACLGLAGHEDGFEPELVLPFANFEKAFRKQGFIEDTSIRTRAQRLCLQSIHRILEFAVESIAESEPASMSDVVGILPLVNTAGLAWITILPSVIQTDDEVCGKVIDQILDSSEWLISRGQGFPGNYFEATAIRQYDQLRSILSLAAGVISFNAPQYEQTIKEMRLSSRDGAHSVGTVVLQMARETSGVEGIEFVRGLTRMELHRKQGANFSELSTSSLLELSALTWHMGVEDRDYIKGAIEGVRDPRGQFYLTKALEGAPWG